MVACAFSPSTQDRGAGEPLFKAGLVYIVSSSITRATQRNSAFRKKDLEILQSLDILEMTLDIIETCNFKDLTCLKTGTFKSWNDLLILIYDTLGTRSERL